MARTTADYTRQRIFDAAYKLFYRRGYGRVGMDDIAEQAGVTKRTLYYHFKSKDDLLAGVLEHQHGLAIERVQTDGRNCAGNAEDVLSARFNDLSKWAAKRSWTGSGFTRLAMELADLPGHPARRMARRHKAEVEGWLRDRLAEAGSSEPQERARENSILLEGAMAMILISGDRSYADVARRMALAMVISEQQTLGG
jgi:AcrR family transcriptional regulator